MNKIGVLLLAIVGGACDRVALGDGPRKAAIRSVTDEVIVPTYEELSQKTHAMADAVAAYQADASAANLAAAQAAWRSARGPWMEGEAFLIGPGKDQFLDAAIDQSPVDPGRIEETIASPDALTPAYVAGLGANRKGFHAVEYILFGDSSTPRRRDFAAAVAADVAVGSDRLLAAWRDDDYAGRFIEVGSPGAPFTTIKAAMDEVANQTVFLAETVQDAKLGKPMGKTTGAPDPTLAESAPSDNSLDDIASNLRGLRHVWMGARGGTAGTGIGAVVARVRPALDVRVQNEIDAALAAIAAIPRPYADALTARAPELDVAYEAVRTVRRTLAADVIASLGATLTINTNDGD